MKKTVLSVMFEYFPAFRGVQQVMSMQFQMKNHSSNTNMAQNVPVFWKGQLTCFLSPAEGGGGACPDSQEAVRLPPLSGFRFWSYPGHVKSCQCLWDTVEHEISACVYI